MNIPQADGFENRNEGYLSGKIKVGSIKHFEGGRGMSFKLIHVPKYPDRDKDGTIKTNEQGKKIYIEGKPVFIKVKLWEDKVGKSLFKACWNNLENGDQITVRYSLHQEKKEAEKEGDPNKYFKHIEGVSRSWTSKQTGEVIVLPAVKMVRKSTYQDYLAKKEAENKKRYEETVEAANKKAKAKNEKAQQPSLDEDDNDDLPF